MKLVFLFFPLASFLLFATQTTSQTASNVFDVYGEYRKNMSYVKANATIKILYLKTLLEQANATIFADLEFLSDIHKEYSTNLTNLEMEAQNQTLNISECVTIHHVMDSYVADAIKTFVQKWYDDVFNNWNVDFQFHLNMENNFEYGSFKEETKALFTAIMACDDASACLSNMTANIYKTYTNYKNEIETLLYNHNFDISNGIINTSKSITNSMYDDIKHIISIFNSEIDCLRLAGLDIP